MNDETNPALETPDAPPILEPGTPARNPRPFSYWVKKLLVCNPFYLASAALLLYGIYRISVDPVFLATETRQLLFSSAALQIYELLLALTATALVTRRIWYDASLLVVLENMLWVVPFILVSQAAFIEQPTAIWLCGLAIALAVTRAVWLRVRARAIMPAPGMLLCGLPVLLANAVWPVVYRHFQETKIGINMTSGAAYEFNEANWFWLLPTLAALLLLLPQPATNPGGSQMRRWFPLLLFGCWLLGTGAHLYSLGYVYDFKLRREQLAPALWVLAWAMQLRLSRFLALPGRACNWLLLCLPGLATFPAMFVPGSRVSFYLSALNFVGYGIVLLRQRDNRLALQLGLGSFAAVVATLPIDFAPFLARPITQTNTVGLALLAYLIVSVLLSCNPKVTILGAVAALIGGGLARQAHPDWMHWAAQTGFVYFLLHSLRWEDEKHIGAGVIRIVVAASWVIHTFILVRGGATFVESLVAAGIVLATWTLRGVIVRCWRPLVLPIAAVLAILTSPFHWLTIKTQAAPAGLLYVVGSFVLFGLGTLAALTKHRWHKTHQS